MDKGQTTATMIIRTVGLLLGAVATAIIARVLQPEKFGEYAFVLAVVTTLSVPLIKGLRFTLVREFGYARAVPDTDRIETLWSWVLRRSIYATFACAIILGSVIIWGVDDAELRVHFAFGLLLFLLLPAPQLLGGALHGLGQVSQSQFPEFVLRPFLTILLFVLVWVAFDPLAITVQAALMIFALTLVADTALCFILLRRSAGFRIMPKAAALPKDQTRMLTLSALSFGAIASVYMINNNLDVVMLGLLSTDTEVGLYKAAAELSSLAAFGLGVINTVIMPQIAKLHAQGDRAALQLMLVKATRIISVFAFGGALLIWGGGTLLLNLIYDDSYVGGYWVLIILTFGHFANACFGPVALILNMTGHQKLTLIGVSASVVINFSLNLMLVPRYGMEGAAVATMVSLVLWNILLTWAVRTRTGYGCSVFASKVPAPI